MKPTSCTFPDCGRSVTSKGLCQTHYLQMHRGEELRPIKLFRGAQDVEPCSFPDCERLAHAKGLCVPHRKQQLRGQELRTLKGVIGECIVEGCGRPVNSRGHCQTHAKYRKAGKELKPILPPTYRYLDSAGYIRIKDPAHPNAAKNGMVMEHVMVMADMLGRPVAPGETVHHINGQRDDNRPENLQLRQGRHGKGARFVCLDCGSHNVEAVQIGD